MVAVAMDLLGRLPTRGVRVQSQVFRGDRLRVTGKGDQVLGEIANLPRFRIRPIGGKETLEDGLRRLFTSRVGSVVRHKKPP